MSGAVWKGSGQGPLHAIIGGARKTLLGSICASPDLDETDIPAIWPCHAFSGALNARLRRALQDPAAPFRPEIRNIEESE